MQLTVIVEHCSDMGAYLGYVPGFPGAHSQAETLDELNKNPQEVIAMLLEVVISNESSLLITDY